MRTTLGRAPDDSERVPYLGSRYLPAEFSLASPSGECFARRCGRGVEVPRDARVGGIGNSRPGAHRIEPLLLRFLHYTGNSLGTLGFSFRGAVDAPFVAWPQSLSSGSRACSARSDADAPQLADRAIDAEC